MAQPNDLNTVEMNDDTPPKIDNEIAIYGAEELEEKEENEENEEIDIKWNLGTWFGFIIVNILMITLLLLFSYFPVVAATLGLIYSAALGYAGFRLKKDVEHPSKSKILNIVWFLFAMSIQFPGASISYTVGASYYYYLRYDICHYNGISLSDQLPYNYSNELKSWAETPRYESGESVNPFGFVGTTLYFSGIDTSSSDFQNVLYLSNGSHAEEVYYTDKEGELASVSYPMGFLSYNSGLALYSSYLQLVFYIDSEDQNLTSLVPNVDPYNEMNGEDDNESNIYRGSYFEIRDLIVGDEFFFYKNNSYIYLSDGTSAGTYTSISYFNITNSTSQENASGYSCPQYYNDLWINRLSFLLLSWLPFSVVTGIVFYFYRFPSLLVPGYLSIYYFWQSIIFFVYPWLVSTWLFAYTYLTMTSCVGLCILTFLSLKDWIRPLTLAWLMNFLSLVYFFFMHFSIGVNFIEYDGRWVVYFISLIFMSLVSILSQKRMPLILAGIGYIVFSIWIGTKVTRVTDSEAVGILTSCFFGALLIGISIRFRKAPNRIRDYLIERTRS